MPRTNPSREGTEQESSEAVAREVAEIDSELVAAYWRRLHAVWDEDVEQLDEARAAIDVLLDRRLELTQTPGAEAASACEVRAPVG
jgi:hypothetical protein